MNELIASTVSSRLLKTYQELNAVLWVIKENCDETEFKQFRKEFGTVMAHLAVNVLEPIFREHPHLTPPELRRESR
jgi:hypothetical protein